MRVFIAVKHGLMRDAIVLSLGLSGTLDVVGSSAGDGALQQIEMLRPEGLLIDATLDGATSLAEAVRERLPFARLVILSHENSDQDSLAWARLGISGRVAPNTSLEDLGNALLDSCTGAVRTSPRTGKAFEPRTAVANAKPDLRRSEGLTARELEILGFLNQGCSNKVIARRLGISNSTVKNHVHNVLEKLGVESRGQAASRFRASISPHRYTGAGSATASVRPTRPAGAVVAAGLVPP